MTVSERDSTIAYRDVQLVLLAPTPVTPVPPTLTHRPSFPLSGNRSVVYFSQDPPPPSFVVTCPGHVQRTGVTRLVFNVELGRTSDRERTGICIFISVLRPANQYGHLKAIHTLKLTHNQK